MTNVYQTTTNGDVIPKEITGTVERVERTGLTAYGNPITRIYVNGVSVDGRDWSGIYRISDNASMVYEITNLEFKSEEHTFALTRAGRISHVVRR